MRLLIIIFITMFIVRFITAWGIVPAARAGMNRFFDDNDAAWWTAWLLIIPCVGTAIVMARNVGYIG